MSIPALYFDGKTSRAHHVTLSVEGGQATISGDAERSCPLDELRVSERARNTKRKVTFPDEAYLEKPILRLLTRCWLIPAIMTPLSYACSKAGVVRLLQWSPRWSCWC